MLFFLAGGMVGKTYAADTSTLATLRQIAKQDPRGPEYVAAVIALIKSSVKTYLDSPKGKQKAPMVNMIIISDIIAERL